MERVFTVIEGHIFKSATAPRTDDGIELVELFAVWEPNVFVAVDAVKKVVGPNPFVEAVSDLTEQELQKLSVPKSGCARIVLDSNGKPTAKPSTRSQLSGVPS
jgi:hypothetical protein